MSSTLQAKFIHLCISALRTFYKYLEENNTFGKIQKMEISEKSLKSEE